MYCPLKLWHLRAWARAVGGFGNMTRNLRATLVITERACDEAAIVVEHYNPQLKEYKLVHVDFLHPGGSLPHPTIWRPLCHAALAGDAFRSDGVMRLCQRVDDLLRERYGMNYERFPGRYYLTSEWMASLDDGAPRRQAERQFDKSIKMVKAWRFVDWYSLLFDDAHSCGPSRGPPGTHSLCGGCGDTIGALTMPPSDDDASLRCVNQAPKRASTCSSVPVVEEDVGCGEK